MYIVEITLEVTEPEYRKMADALLNSCDNDTLVGIRVKDIEGRPENELAPEALCRVFSVQPVE